MASWLNLCTWLQPLLPITLSIWMELCSLSLWIYNSPDFLVFSWKSHFIRVHTKRQRQTWNFREVGHELRNMLYFTTLSGLDQMPCTLICDLPSCILAEAFRGKRKWPGITTSTTEQNVSVNVCASSTFVFNVVFRGQFLVSHCVNLSSRELHTITSPGPTTAVYWQPPSIPFSCWITTAGRGFTNIVFF